MGEACLDEVKTRFNGNGENIFVSVRVRPLNANEIARRDVSDWECINDDTIFFRNNLSLPERSVYPSAYTFDRVFGCDCSTRQVYEEGAKEVAFSVVNGINSSIFAYGQTSSGKTYTMGGITEYAMADIYEYIEANKEREYFLKFSAMEIYNESVRDLLSYDCTPLRLLDDPERGTIVEKLTEETLMDWNHLRELLSLCEAQRQVGETSLNETSSRSHQILRLTVDSSSNDFLGNDHPNTLTATVNFIDLAGSERASQSLSAGSRLKEGCHINRSLLTLGTVIRKLSKGRNGHVPFRDSKLTRILQSSLDGNARTAIICTMSPARTHVEQSRNTLLFASCAKEVTTNAQVNVVVSDKALVKHLQRELSRLEVELRSSRTNSVTSEAMALLMEKDIQIVELKKEIAKLIAERDHAQSHAEDFPRRLEDEESSFSLEGSHSNYPKLRVCKSWAEEIPTFDISSISDSHPTDTGSFQAHANCDRHSKSKLEDDYLQIPDCEGLFMNKYTSSRMSNISGETNPCKGWDEIDESIDEIVEDLCKEVRCIEMEESSTKRHIESKTYFHQENPKLSTLKSVENVENEDKELASCLSKEEIELSPTDNDRLLDFSSPEKVSLWIPQRVTSTSRLLSLYKSRSCKSTLMSSSSSLPFESVGINGNTLPIMPERGFNGISMGLKIKVPVPTSNHDHENETLPRKDYNNLLSSVAIKGLKENTMPSMPERDFNGRPAGLKIKVPVTTLNYDHENEAIPRKDYNNLVSSVAKEGLKEQNGTASCDEDSTSIDTIKEMVKLQNEKLPNTPAQVTEPETKAFVTITKDVCSDPFQDDSQSPQNWPLKFKSLQADIIELWDACNTSLLHRTYFYLLFEGDLADAIYMEVELRRLSFLKDTFSQGKETVEDGYILTLASSMKALRQEREMLSKQMLKKLSEQERENLYLKWGVDSKTKNRRLQLADRLWTDTNDMSHITESANVVANLVSFIKPVHANKEMFGLNFTPRHTTRRKSFSWKRSLLSLL